MHQLLQTQHVRVQENTSHATKHLFHTVIMKCVKSLTLKYFSTYFRTLREKIYTLHILLRFVGTPKL